MWVGVGRCGLACVCGRVFGCEGVCGCVSVGAGGGAEGCHLEAVHGLEVAVREVEPGAERVGHAPDGEEEAEEEAEEEEAEKEGEGCAVRQGLGGGRQWECSRRAVF